MCRSTTHINALEQDESDECESGNEEFFIDTVSTGDEEDWKVTVGINEKKVTLKIDTGAQCNSMSKKLYDKISQKAPNKSKVRIISYSGHKIPTCGEAMMAVSYKDKYHTVKFHIVEQDLRPLIGGKTSLDMGLVKRCYAMNVDPSEPIPSYNSIIQEYKDVFEGLGCLSGEYNVQLKENAKPVVHPPRKIPFAIRDKVKAELDRMETLGVIQRVEHPTDWVNSMVVVEKPNKVRICLDPRDLNQNIKREHYPMKTVEEVAAKLAGANVFSVLDAGHAFWQVKIDEESSQLLTFNSPFGRYQCKRLPFGINSAPEIFQRKVSQMFEGLEGTDVIMDDILVWGKDKTEHDHRLKQTLDRVRSENLKLNPKKSKIGMSQVTYIGHTMGKNGLEASEDKIDAILKMPRPECKKDLQRFMGMVNYLAKFIPNVSMLNKDLRILLQKDIAWHWEARQEKCFNELKDTITKAPVLAYYNVSKPVTLSVDASSVAMGACILQENQPIAYGSKAMNQAQKNYGQIEKEMLAIVFGCHKFHQYIYGKQNVLVETDHKPLESLFKKPLSSAPPRIQRMMLKLQKYDLRVSYTPGSKLYIADTLSRATLDEQSCEELDEFEIYTLDHMPISDTKLSELKKETKSDRVLAKLESIVLNGWPCDKSEIDPDLSPYWQHRDEISVLDGLLLKGERLIVPQSMCSEMLRKVHSSHMGIESCKRRARDTLYWPGMNGQISDIVSQCSVCNQYRNAQPKEPMLGHDIPERPWQKVGADLYEFIKETYLLLTDYYSKYVEISRLSSLTSASIISHMKGQFSRHGIPETLISDNGPQFSSAEFSEFASSYNFEHTTSSPTYAQSNGLVERMVQTTKNILKKAKASKKDASLALLALRNTPIEGLGVSPAQLLMGRRTRTLIPTNPSLLKPAPVTSDIQARLAEKQRKQKAYYDRNAKPLPEITPGESVRVRVDNEWKPAVVAAYADEPRSYIVTSGGGTYRRNRRHILKTNEPPNTAAPMPDQAKPNSTANQSSPNSPSKQPASTTPASQIPIPVRGKRTIRKPLRYRDTA